LPQQLLGYAVLFGALALLFRVQYGRPFWKSLGWRPSGMPFLWMVIFGFLMAILVALLGSLIRTPTTSNQMTQLMQDRVSMILMAIFGTTVAPVSEELVFRGFLQPLLVRSLGAAAGIVISALPFGFLHYHEYGNSWRHAVLIALAGASFGVMRHVTGSTRAAAIMHAAYNGIIFIAVFGQGKLGH
jgi:membrane protease YdiL (CAAX protease family)